MAPVAVHQLLQMCAKQAPARPLPDNVAVSPASLRLIFTMEYFIALLRMCYIQSTSVEPSCGCLPPALHRRCPPWLSWSSDPRSLSVLGRECVSSEEIIPQDDMSAGMIFSTALISRCQFISHQQSLLSNSPFF